MAITWEEVDPKEFDNFPEPKAAKRPDPYEGLIPALEAGKTITVHLPTDAKVRGARMAIGRRAKEAGVAIEMRYSGNDIVVRKVGTVAPVTYAKRGRKPKSQTP